MNLASAQARPLGASSATRTASDIEIERLTKTYGDFSALRNISLSIRPSEFVAILGPSGSGKSTLLMAVAGFTNPDSGSIRVNGQEIIHKPANARGFGVVFQNYALFPHMNVFENVAFPLRLRKLDKHEIAKRTNEALETVKLGGFAGRAINELSGGQRQRVALARAIVYEPQVLLMDEPLSALDKSLREEMQIEIRELHNKLNITTIYVTHDQREALTMADRIAVMNRGDVLQIDTPERIYRRPANEFVARFLGEAIVFRFDEANRLLRGGQLAGGEGRDLVMLRSEDLRLAPPAEHDCLSIRARVHAVVFQGDSWLLQIETTDGRTISARAQRAFADRLAELTTGNEAEFFVKRSDIHFIRAES